MQKLQPTKNFIKQWWQDLGFFYDQDIIKQCWRFTGSKKGLENFCTTLFKYSQNPHFKTIGSHDHYGPHWYLKIVTWHEPIIEENAIGGTVEDIFRLGQIIKNNISMYKKGDIFYVGEEYSQKFIWYLSFDIRHEDFDPSSIDPLI